MPLFDKRDLDFIKARAADTMLDYAEGIVRCDFCGVNSSETPIAFTFEQVISLYDRCITTPNRNQQRKDRKLNQRQWRQDNKHTAKQMKKFSQNPELTAPWFFCKSCFSHIKEKKIFSGQVLQEAVARAKSRQQSES